MVRYEQSAHVRDFAILMHVFPPLLFAGVGVMLLITESLRLYSLPFFLAIFALVPFFYYSSRIDFVATDEGDDPGVYVTFRGNRAEKYIMFPAIEELDIVDYNCCTWCGFGCRHSGDSWAYSVGGNPRALCFTLNDSSFQVTLPNPEEAMEMVKEMMRRDDPRAKFNQRENVNPRLSQASNLSASAPASTRMSQASNLSDGLTSAHMSGASNLSGAGLRMSQASGMTNADNNRMTQASGMTGAGHRMTQTSGFTGAGQRMTQTSNVTGAAAGHMTQASGLTGMAAEATAGFASGRSAGSRGSRASRASSTGRRRASGSRTSRGSRGSRTSTASRSSAGSGAGRRSRRKSKSSSVVQT